MLQNYQERERLVREAVRKSLKNVPWLFTKEGNRQLYRADMERENIEKLVEFAREGDKDAVEILQNRGRVARSTRAIMPMCYHAFVSDWFLDGPPKAKSGSGPKDTGYMLQTIAVLVNRVSQDYGFPEYRNPEHRGKITGPMSACRLVAEEMGLSEGYVEEIWADYKESVTGRRPRPN